jgi:tetratricopeptide (TPR) repeat protein
MTVWRTTLLASCLVAVAALRPLVAEAANDPRTVSGAYLSGAHALVARDLANAGRFFGQVLDSDPDNLNLLRRSFTLTLAGGDVDGASKLAARLDTADTTDQLVRITLILHDVKVGQWRAALDRLKSVETVGTAKSITPILSAWLRVGAGDGKAALTSLDPLLKGARPDALGSIQKALLLDYLGDLDGAAKAYEALGDMGKTARLVEGLASVYQRQGQRDKARDLYRAFTEDNSENLLLEPAIQRLDKGDRAQPIIGSPAEGLAEALFYIASAVSQDPQSDGGDTALIYTRLALYLRPDFPVAQVLLGDVLAGQEQYQNAITAYEALPDSTPAGWMARLRETLAYEGLRDFDKGIALASDLVSERPDSPAGYLRLGDLYRAKEDFASAVVAYDDAARRQKRLEEIDWTFLYRRGIALERSGRFDRAEQDLRRAIGLNPQNANLLNYLGYSLLDRGKDLKEAEDLIRKAVDLTPDDGYIIDSLGWVYYRTDQVDKAVETLEKAILLKPEDPTINDHLGDAYWRVGRKVEARFQWEAALRTTEGDPPKDKILAKLAGGLPPDAAAPVTSN